MRKPVARATCPLPLATALAAILGSTVTPSASAATLLVTDCTDGAGSGTLRNTIQVAPDLSTIEIPLACSTITLTQGAIAIPGRFTDLTIVGQGPSVTMIDAGARASPAQYNRAIKSNQQGTLMLNHLTIAHAKYTGATSPHGGCIYAEYDVYLTDAVLTDCRAAPLSGSATAKGGAIYSGGYVTLNHSVVSNSSTANVTTQGTLGGGIYAKHGFSALFSTIAGKSALGDALFSRGGGVYSADGDVTLIHSTISGNHADINSALEARDPSNTYYFSADNSTISGNKSNQVQTVGAYTRVHFFNSTLAFNLAHTENTNAPAGLYSNSQIKAYSSIFAENGTQNGPGHDLYSKVPTDPIFGSNMLITATNNPVPLGTLSSCPHLGHLSDNGGPTLTIPLLAGSQAIDAGITFSSGYDQRGAGFPRTVGNAPDIGAYERQAGMIDDVVFFSGFDSRCN